MTLQIELVYPVNARFPVSETFSDLGNAEILHLHLQQKEEESLCSSCVFRFRYHFKDSLKDNKT